MTWQELLQAALTLVVAFTVRWFFQLIGVELDDATFAALVGAIVTYLLALFGIEVFRGMRHGFKGGMTLFRAPKE